MMSICSCLSARKRALSRKLLLTTESVLVFTPPNVGNGSLLDVCFVPFAWKFGMHRRVRLVIPSKLARNILRKLGSFIHAIQLVSMWNIGGWKAKSRRTSTLFQKLVTMYQGEARSDNILFLRLSETKWYVQLTGCHSCPASRGWTRRMTKSDWRNLCRYRHPTKFWRWQETNRMSCMSKSQDNMDGFKGPIFG